MSSKLSPKKKAAVYAKTNGTCSYCDEKISDENAVIDHVVPKSKGGKNNIENLLPCCWSCNSSKGTKSLDDFRLYCAVKLVTGAVLFGQAQINYIYEAGAFHALGFDENYKFPFEREGVAS